MPILHVQVSPLQNPQQYTALADALTRITAEHLLKRSEVTAVVIDDVPAAKWHIAGRSVTRPTAFVEISITQGTNTSEQKARFIAAVFAELQTQLGHGHALEEASYVIVREVPGSDWGYGGVSQAERHIHRMS